MGDASNVLYVERHVDPFESRIIAQYTFAEGEIAQFSRFLNRASRGGAALDYVTRTGTSVVGYSGGPRFYDGAGTWSKTVITTGVALGMVYKKHANPTASRFPLISGAGTQQHFRVENGAPYLRASLNGGAVYSNLGFDPIDRGAMSLVIRHNADVGQQELYCDGRLMDADVIAAVSVPTAGVDTFGSHGELQQSWFYDSQPTPAEIRAKHVLRARRVVCSWKPQNVGEGPAGGIPTIAVGEGDWFCPSGGATLQFVYRRSSAMLRQGQLALTDAGALSMRRLDFAHTRMPAFGSWHFRIQLRDPATDNPRFGLIGVRGTDFTAGGSDGYWVQVQRSGGVMQATLHEAASGANLTINHTATGATDDVCDVLLTRYPSGDFRIYLAVNGVWASNADATVWNDVTTLATNFVSVAPRQSYVLGYERFQGEMLPGEAALGV